MVRVFLRWAVMKVGYVMLVSTLNSFSPPFYVNTSPVAGIYWLWNRIYGLSVAVNFAVATSLLFVAFFDMRGFMVVFGWVSLAVLGVCIAGIVFTMYLMGVVTDDFAVIRAFRSEALSHMLPPVVVFILGCTSLLLTV